MFDCSGYWTKHFGTREKYNIKGQYTQDVQKMTHTPIGNPLALIGLPIGAKGFPDRG